MNRLILVFTQIYCSYVFGQTPLDIRTTEFPPYQYRVGSKIVGVSAALVKAIFEKANLQYTMAIYPWVRAERDLNRESPVFFFNLSRTPERESKFEWIADITPNHPVLWKLKKRKDILLKSVADCGKWTLAILPNESTSIYLKKNGVPESKFTIVKDNSQGIKMLFNERVDLLPLDERVFLFQSKLYGYSPSSYEKALSLTGANTSSYLVANPAVPKTVVKELKLAWEQLKRDGTVDAIRKKYLAQSGN